MTLIKKKPWILILANSEGISKVDFMHMRKKTHCNILQRTLSQTLCCLHMFMMEKNRVASGRLLVAWNEIYTLMVGATSKKHCNIAITRDVEKAQQIQSNV